MKIIGFGDVDLAGKLNYADLWSGICLDTSNPFIHRNSSHPYIQGRHEEGMPGPDPPPLLLHQPPYFKVPSGKLTGVLASVPCLPEVWAVTEHPQRSPETTPAGPDVSGESSLRLLQVATCYNVASYTHLIPLQHKALDNSTMH